MTEDAPAAPEVVVERLRAALERRPEIVWAVLHGSVLEERSFQDLDVAVWLDPACVCEWRRYEVDLAAALHLDLKVPVDVRVLNDAPVAFRYHALGGRPLVVRDWERFDEMRARTWDEYFDFLPFARAYLREVLGA